MELWIRSQDREDLIKAQAIYFDDIGGTADIICSSFANRLVIGTYKSKKRALEVLDEIENLLLIDGESDGEYEQQDLYIKSIIANSMYKVYEMPKE